ncbi:hypothetical protein BZJ17_14530 [Salinivibrio sp. IB574]|uniref:hypothetical protein n=1 Tax=Salinivibrio sp. IB574 TaxID=1909444 RepID=UPI000988C0A7|nr:hypothetical protein [Salinivibrio sp. IB574]OOF19904.1 hypothetical protein BZJ17_14530 [Salinivibrio sp. IB574]
MSTQFFCGVDLAKHHLSLHADNSPVTGLAGSGETAVTDLLYVFAVSNDLMAEITEPLLFENIGCSRSQKMQLPIDRRRAHMCYV